MADMYLQIDGLRGDSADRDHKDWIEIVSFTHAIDHPVSASPAGTAGARTHHSDYSVTKRVDQTSPKLYEMCSSGKHLKNVTLEMMRGSGENRVRYMQVKLEEVLVSHVAPSGGADFPTEAVGFNYGKITWTYTAPKRADGSQGGNVTAGWNLLQNKVAA